LKTYLRKRGLLELDKLGRSLARFLKMLIDGHLCSAEMGLNQLNMVQIGHFNPTGHHKSSNALGFSFILLFSRNDVGACLSEGALVAAAFYEKRSPIRRLPLE
jgi:hypothetical protein